MQLTIIFSISIFDEDNSNTVDYKELIIGLETFKDNTIDEKLKGKLLFFIYFFNYYYYIFFYLSLICNNIFLLLK